jgi:hypothetical protein
MNKTDLRNEFLKTYNKENGGRPLEEYEISKNPNYVDFLEEKLIFQKNETSGLIVTDKELDIISTKITKDLSEKFDLMSVDGFDIREYISEYLRSITWQL